MLVLASLISVILGNILKLQRWIQCSNHSDLCSFLFEHYSDSQTILTWKKSFYHLWIHCMKEVSLCLKFPSTLFTHFLKMLLEICKGTKRDTCQKFELNTFLVGVDFWAIIQEVGHVRRVEAASVPLAFQSCSKGGEVCKLLSIWQLSQAIITSVAWLRRSDR